MLSLSNRASRGALAVALIAASGWAAPAFAAALDGAPAIAPVSGGADDGEAITVTARHREENLQDVPLAISAISGKELNGQHLDRLPDYAAKIPNFSAFATNPRVATVNIRGLGGNASNDGAEGGVGIIVDDVFFTHVGFSWLDFVDLESVEVARGPQGTLLGKNTTIGAVIVRTAKPSFDPSLNISATLGDHGRYQLRANATGPINDKLAYRITFAGDTGGGWITNHFNGDKLLDNNRWSVRGQLLFKPADGITDRLIAEHYNFSEFNNHTSPVADLTSNYRTDGTVLSSRGVSWTNAVARLAPGYTPSLTGPQNANFDTLGRTRQRVTGVSNTLDVDLGFGKLTSVSAYRNLWFRPQNDFDLTPYPAWDTGFNVDVDQYSQELRIASRDKAKTEWQAGAYYLHEDLTSENYNRFYSGASAYFDILGTWGTANAPTAAALNGLTLSKPGHVKVDSGAIFGQITQHVTDRFSITGGLRVTRERKKLDVQTNVLVGPTGLANASLSATDLAYRNTILSSAVLGGAFADTPVSDTRNFVSWVVNPAYKVTDDVLLYLNVSGGAKSGATNTTATPALFAAGKAIIAPEKSFDIEFGAKSSWFDKKLDVNLNFYRNDIKDYQAAQVDPNVATLGSILGNVGKVRLQGVELESNLHITKTISLSGNVAYNDAKYRSYDNAPAPVEFQTYLAGVQGVAAKATTLSLTGYQVAGVPKWTANGTINFEHPIAAKINLTGYLNENFRSSTQLINPRSLYGFQSAYGLTNAGLGLKADDGNWAVSLWVKNLFDKRFALGYGAPTAFTPLLYYWGDHRTFGITANKKF